jgi:3-hydroxyacyl-[acyl-carrier-protein] dehydratase
MSDAVFTSGRLEIDAHHPAFEGHFPGRPILPGVALLAAVLEAAAGEPRLAASIGSAPRLAFVKFLAPVAPGASLAIEFRLGASAVDWQIDDRDRTVASGRIARADGGAASAA